MHNGAHFPLSMATKNASARSAPKAKARAERERLGGSLAKGGKEGKEEPPQRQPAKGKALNAPDWSGWWNGGKGQWESTAVAEKGGKGAKGGKGGKEEPPQRQPAKGKGEREESTAVAENAPDWASAWHGWRDH